MDKYVYYRTVTTMISGLSTAHDGTTMTILLMMFLMMSFYAAPINDVKSLMSDMIVLVPVQLLLMLSFFADNGLLLLLLPDVSLSADHGLLLPGFVFYRRFWSFLRLKP